MRPRIEKVTADQRKQNHEFMKKFFTELRRESEIKFRKLTVKEGLHFLQNADEFGRRVKDVTLGLFEELSSPRTLSSQLQEESFDPKFGYFSGYKKPESLGEQTRRLRELVPGLGLPNLDLQDKIERGEIALPEHAEGWFAIPNWPQNSKIWGLTYNTATQKIIKTLRETRRFETYRDHEIGAGNLRQSERTEEFLRKLSEAQGNPDILIVPAQFGLQHRRTSQHELQGTFIPKESNEFGLGLLAVGSMLITHPERLSKKDDLLIDCSGDLFNEKGRGSGDYKLVFCFVFTDRVRLSALNLSEYCDRRGEATGFFFEFQK